MPIDGHSLLILTQIPGIGPHRLRLLVAHFGTLEAVLRAAPRELAGVEGVDAKTASLIAGFRKSAGMEMASRFADRQLNALHRCNAGLVTLWEPEYPANLKKIYDPPPFLFLCGTLESSDATSVAIVGTREPSPYGIQMAEMFATGFARLGVSVVSGLARGVDTVAHLACVRSEARTLAVIGSGVDIIYPSENKGLADRIRDHGAILSEFVMGTKPDACNFPRRNRIISGMTLGTLVIETGIDGGAIITAGLALDQNREVFAVPSPIHENRPGGTNRLIREGKALLVETVDDILAELAPRLKDQIPSLTNGRSRPQQEMTLFEQNAYDALPDDERMHIDVLAERTSLTVSELLVHLLSLEFKGLVRQLPGKFFVRG